MIETERKLSPRETDKPAGGRDLGLDLVRALAGFLVVSVHFFLHSGYYAQPLAGGRMFLMTAMRMGFMTCVPLFLLLTGCLCRGKELTARHYLGLFPTLLTYLLCTLACQGTRLWRGEAITLRQGVRELLDFTGAPYAWYIEMYIGLYCLIPFLNLAWRGLETKRRRGALVGVLLLLTSLPTLTNLRHAILPDYWLGLYPFAYYFLGAYLGEYRPKVDWRWGLPALAGAVLAGSGMVFWNGHGAAYPWTAFGDWNGPTVALSACLLFCLARQLPVARAPRPLRWLIAKGAALSLGIYLLSWCFDSALYPLLLARVPNTLERWPWYFVVVPAVYLGSALASQGVEWLRGAVTWCLNRALPRLGLK